MSIVVLLGELTALDHRKDVGAIGSDDPFDDVAWFAQSVGVETPPSDQ